MWTGLSGWYSPKLPLSDGAAMKGLAGRPATAHTGSLSLRTSQSWDLPSLLSFPSCTKEGCLCLFLCVHSALSCWQVTSWSRGGKVWNSIYISPSISHALQTVTPTAFLPSCPDLFSTPARWWRHSARHAEPESIPILPSNHPGREAVFITTLLAAARHSCH